jgi:hypothetical protein
MNHLIHIYFSTLTSSKTSIYDAYAYTPMYHCNQIDQYYLIYIIYVYKEYFPLFLMTGQINCSDFKLLEAIFQHHYKCITKSHGIFFFNFRTVVHYIICYHLNLYIVVYNEFVLSRREIYILTNCVPWVFERRISIECINNRRAFLAQHQLRFIT